MHHHQLAPTGHKTIETDRRTAWAQTIQAWLDTLRAKGSTNTAKAYRIAAKQFFRWTGPDIPPWNIDPGLAQDWATWLTTQCKLADASVNQKLAGVASLYKFAQTHGLWPPTTPNPFATVERPRVAPYGRATFPTTRELKNLLAAINTHNLTGKRDYALLFTITVTCRRASEILNLQWGDIHPSSNGNGDYWFYYRSKGNREKTRRGVLLRECHHSIITYLHAAGRLAGITPPDYIFTPLHPHRIRHLQPHLRVDPNRPLSNSFANRILKKYARRTGIDPHKAHLHALRHAGARLRHALMKAGRGSADYQEIQRLLGHRDINTTIIYTDQVLADPQDPTARQAAIELMPPKKQPKTPGKRGPPRTHNPY